MSASDPTSALRSRRAADTEAVASPARTTGRPSDLVVTADMIPDPLAVEAAGDLTSVELHDLDVCERAVDNLTTARWLAGKALASIRDRKLYRQTHPTFEEYVVDRWEMSERAAYQAIEEWPLAQLLQLALGKPVTASHTRALLPVAHCFGLPVAVDLYEQLRQRASADALRLTAAVIGRLVEAVLAQTGKKVPPDQFQAAARQLMSGALPEAASPAVRAVAPPKTSPPSSSSDRIRAAEQTSTDAPPPVAEGNPQFFAGDHEPATHLRTDLPSTDALGGSQPETMSPEEVIHNLQVILHRVQEVQGAIYALVGVDEFLDGEAEDLRRDIRRRLLLAAECYRPPFPSTQDS